MGYRRCTNFSSHFKSFDFHVLTYTVHSKLALRWRVGLMAGLDQTDPSKDLEDLLGKHGVDPSTISSIMSEGWSLATFAMAATSLDLFDPLQFDSEASALQQARLRGLLA